jgi:hypothetical protein
VSTLKNGGATGEKSKGRAKTRLTLGKVYSAMKNLVLDFTKRDRIAKIENRHAVGETAALNATGETSYIRGDNNRMLKRSQLWLLQSRI